MEHFSENISERMFHVEHFCAKAGHIHPQVTIAATICLSDYAAPKSVIANAQRFGLFCIASLRFFKTKWDA